MPATDPNDLEPIEPRTAGVLYLDHSANQCRGKSGKSHEYRTNFFVTWSAENGGLNNVTM